MTDVDGETCKHVSFSPTTKIHEIEHMTLACETHSKSNIPFIPSSLFKLYKNTAIALLLLAKFEWALIAKCEHNDNELLKVRRTLLGQGKLLSPVNDKIFERNLVYSIGRTELRYYYSTNSSFEISNVTTHFYLLQTLFIKFIFSNLLPLISYKYKYKNNFNNQITREKNRKNEIKQNQNILKVPSKILY